RLLRSTHLPACRRSGRGVRAHGMAGSCSQACGQFWRRSVSVVVQATGPQRMIIPPLPQAESCVLVIFGASGDLTRRKLIPALYDLACAGCTHRNFEILGTGRTPMNSEEFRARMRQGVSEGNTVQFDSERWTTFEPRLSYLAGDPGEMDFYSRLRVC